MTWHRDGTFKRMDFWLVSEACIPRMHTADIRRSVGVHHPWFKLRDQWGTPELDDDRFSMPSGFPKVFPWNTGGEHS